MCTIDEIDNYICFISKTYIDLQLRMTIIYYY